jgi:hypothetical protein
MGVELFRDRRIALLSATLLAISFWHILFSRIGFRAISQPLMQTLTIAALYIGLRHRSLRWIAIAGIALGITGYTYLAARLFPIPLVIAAIPLLIDGKQRSFRLKQLVVFFGVGLVTLLPLIVYFSQNPDSFWVRIEQVGPGNISLTEMAESYWRSLKMLFLDGDPYWRFNLPNRPILNWFWGLLLVIGWFNLIFRNIGRRYDWRGAADVLLIITPLMMLIPTALATAEIVPSNLRAIGLIPFIYLLPGFGLFITFDSLWDRVTTFSNTPPDKVKRLMALIPEKINTSNITVVVILATLVIGSILVVDDYFHDWLSRVDVYYETESELIPISNYLEDLDLSKGHVYLASRHYRHPTVAFLSDQYDQVRWLIDGNSLVFPAEKSAYYIYPHGIPVSKWVSDFLPESPSMIGPDGPDGKPQFIAYHKTDQPFLSPEYPVQVNFDNYLTLTGYDVRGGTAGDYLPLTLYWLVAKEPAHELMPFVHLEDAWGYRWSQEEIASYPAEQWKKDDQIVVHVEVPLPDGLPPGSYRLRVGFFNPESMIQVPRLDQAGRHAGNSLIVENISVLAGLPSQPLPVPMNKKDQSVLPGLTLLGFERNEMEAATGTPFLISLWWHATEPLPAVLSRFELIGPDNMGWILNTADPVHDSLPFKTWPTPSFIIDHRQPTVPADVPPGSYTLQLRLMDETNATLLLTEMGELTVNEADRLFAPPKTSIPLAATFGDEIALLGYDLDEIEAEKYKLTLVWQAIENPSRSYTVFVHLLNVDGTCCLWQQDIAPKQGTYHTNQWVDGEVIVDDYLIELPKDIKPGLYPIELGLYLAESGQRLLVKMPGIKDNDALYLRTIEIDGRQ